MIALENLGLKLSDRIEFRFLKEDELSFPTLEKTLPLVMTPKDDSSYSVLLDFVEANKDSLKKLVYEYGGILFRDFQIPDLSFFPKILEQMGYDLAEEYSGGLAQRNKLTQKVFSSTNTIVQFPLLAHNEMTYQNLMPTMIAFFCQTEPKRFGETPIFNCVEIYKTIPADLINSLIERKIKYIRRFRKDAANSPLGFSRRWPVMFGTDDKKNIERLCEEAGTKFIWGKDDSLKIESTTYPYTLHPVTQEKCFSIHLLNSHMVTGDILHFFHRMPWTTKLYACFGIFVAQLLFYFHWVPMSVGFGDGKPLNRKITKTIRDAIWRHSVIFKWRQNDILIIDNIKTAHAKMHGERPRKIAVCMGDMMQVGRTV